MERSYKLITSESYNKGLNVEKGKCFEQSEFIADILLVATSWFCIYQKTCRLLTTLYRNIIQADGLGSAAKWKVNVRMILII